MKALITGASSGIGEQFLRIHSAKGYDSVIVARSKDLLNELKDEMESEHGVTVTAYPIDLTDPGASDKIYRKFKDSDVEILINNAGFGLTGEFVETDLDRQRAMIDLNVKALVELSHLFGAEFKAHERGRILNVASVAAFVPGPNQPVYYATKAFVRSLNYALAHLLKDHNVTVTVLNPGVTRTKFFDAAGAGNASIVKSGVDPYDVAKTGYEAMMSGRVEVTHGFGNSFMAHFLMRLIPTGLATRIVAAVSEI